MSSLEKKISQRIWLDFKKEVILYLKECKQNRIEEQRLLEKKKYRQLVLDVISTQAKEKGPESVNAPKFAVLPNGERVTVWRGNVYTDNMGPWSRGRCYACAFPLVHFEAPCILCSKYG